jgi:hypothetical protein
VTRRASPPIFIDEADAAILRKAGFSQVVVWRWKNKRGAPSRIFLPRVIAALGRDPRQPAPVASSQRTADEPVVNNRISPPHRHIEINPCVDDGVCLAVRKAAMRPVANTLLDSRREIPCASCKQGIARARAEAAVRKPTHGDGPRICADPDCLAVLSHGAKGPYCQIHFNRISGQRRALA